MKKVERQVIAYNAACHGLVHILELSYGALLISISREFHSTLFLLGLLANFSGFAFGAAALPSGFLADRLGERRLLFFCCLGIGIASIAVGVSPNIFILGVTLTFLGLALGVYHPVGATHIAKVVPHRGLAFGYFGAGGNFGVALGPILASTIAYFVNWRASYFAFAIAALLLAVVFWSFVRVSVHDAPLFHRSTSANKTSSTPMILPLALVFTIAILSGFIYRGAVTFLPLYLGERVSFPFLNLDTQLLAGSFTTIALIFGVGGQLLGGYLSDQRRRESLAILITFVTSLFLIVVAISYGLILMIAAIIFAFFHFMGQPVFNSLVADYSSIAWRGRSYGIYYFLTFGLGSFSASILGYTADQLGINWSFIIAAGFAFMALVCAILLRLNSKF